MKTTASRHSMLASLSLLASLTVLSACSSSTLSDNEQFSITSAIPGCDAQATSCQIVSIAQGHQTNLSAPQARGITLHCEASCFVQGGGEPLPSYEQVYCITLGNEDHWHAVLYFRTPSRGGVDGFMLPVSSLAAFGQAGCASRPTGFLRSGFTGTHPTAASPPTAPSPPSPAGRTASA